ncbi:carbohydrate kinase family protein [Cellulomonas sp. WB94]|uniref:carbohydrate kinase family protein n=1 Tax=Cellulomonas sp. WB94 TaxID=2173174 RepID=UPI000D57C7A2|nr:PfkB family carbohydrate kinase [Cellulomonas sp. WB94]PVU82975.1 carbohydrate kinase family protein [Cellulomonas sp. WB94]
MAEVVVVGPASWNQIVALDALPEPVPHMELARSSHETIGGTSAGKALHLVELGRDVLLHTVVGTDDVAGRITSRLRDAGVPLLLAVTDGASERHLNLMDPDGGRVSIYLSVPPEAPVGDARVRAEMASARAVVLDLSAHARAMIDDAAATGVPIWTDLHDYDGSSEFHRPFLAAASYVFLNADRIGDDPIPFLHAAVDGGALLAVCTLGARGAVAVDANHAVHTVAAVPVERIVDTNGAGDAFMAGVLAATLDGASTQVALRAGAAQAARALGSAHLSALLDEKETHPAGRRVTAS